MDHNWLEIQMQGEHKRERFRAEAGKRRWMSERRESPAYLTAALRKFWRRLFQVKQGMGKGTSLDRVGSHQTARHSGSVHAN